MHISMCHNIVQLVQDSKEYESTKTGKNVRIVFDNLGECDGRNSGFGQHHHILPFFETFNLTQRPVELVDDAFTSGVMGAEASLEADGSSHSLLIVLIVSNVPMLEVELDAALDLLVFHFFVLPDSAPMRLRFGL